MRIDAVPLEPARGPPLAAGEYLEWLDLTQRALATRGASAVPCGDCSACCRGSYFIHVDASEAKALARIPAALIFPAPGRPDERVLGYDAAGRCPLLDDGGCTIYDDRPASCRTYDCRIFAATGIAEPGAARQAIMARAARWRFDYATPDARFQHEALRAGGRLVIAQAPALAEVLPANATQLAMLLVSRQQALVALARANGLPLPESGSVLAGLRAALADPAAPGPRS